MSGEGWEGRSAPLGGLIRRRPLLQFRRGGSAPLTLPLAYVLQRNDCNQPLKGLIRCRTWVQPAAPRHLRIRRVSCHVRNQCLRAYWWADASQAMGSISGSAPVVRLSVIPSQATVSTGGSGMASIRKRSASLISETTHPSVSCITSSRLPASLLPLRLIPAASPAMPLPSRRRTDTWLTDG